MVGIKKDLPSIDELDKLGIKATQDTDRENRIEALLEKRGWGKTFNYVDPSIRKQLGYRIVRKLIGGWYTVGSTRYHQRGYGWALVVAFIMLGAVISSLVQISAGFIYIAALIIGISVGIPLANAIYQKKTFSIVQIQLKGVETPVAYHLDSNKEKVIDYIKSDQTTVTTYTMPIEAMPKLITINVNEYTSKDGSPTLIATGILKNVVWGDSKFSHLSLDKFLFLEKPGDMYPPKLQDAMDSLKKVVSKHKIPDEDAEEMQELLTKAYSAMDEWKEAMDEIKNRSGKKYVRMKMSKEFDIFLTEVPHTLRILHEKETEIMQKLVERPDETVIEPLNRAIRISTEFGTSLEMLKIEYEQKGRKMGMAEAMMALKTLPNMTDIASKAEISETARKATIGQEALEEFNLKKKLEGIMNGDQEEDE